MKRFLKSVIPFLMLALMALPVSAATAPPANVKRLTVKAVSDTSLKLTWSKAARAQGYEVYLVDTVNVFDEEAEEMIETQTFKRVAKTKKTTLTLKKLATNRTYTYQVRAYNKVGGELFRSEEASPNVSAALKIAKPAKVKNLRIGSYGNKSVFLKWNPAKNATGYAVYRYNTATKSYKRIARTTETGYQVKKLEAGKKYKFMVKSYRTVQKKTKYGAESKAVTAKAKKIDLSKIHGRLFTTVMKTDGKAKDLKTGKMIRIKAGTKIAATAKGTGELKAFLMKDGKPIEIRGSYLSYDNLHTTTKYYTKTQKEAYVNSKGYDSPTPYLLWINQYTLNLTVFKGSKGEWKEVISEPCVVGRYGATGLGVHKILIKTTQYGGPCIFFTWSSRLGAGNAFHRRMSDGVSRAAISGGCIRLGDYVLNYINQNCAIGTTVISY